MAATACAPPSLNTCVDAAQPRGHEHGGVGGAVGARRRAHDAHRATGDARRHRQHHRGGRQRGGARRHVQADGIERHDHAFADDARRGLDAQRRERLQPRGSACTVSIARSSAACCSAVSAASAAANSAARHRERVEPHVVERRRVFTQRRVATRANVVDDATCALEQARGVALRRTAQRSRRAAPRRAPTSPGFRATGSCEHLLDRQHQHRAGAGGLQAFERFPEHGFAADRMHGDLVAGAVERNHRRRFAARQQSP